ncbi:site-specific DNA-methyltransferase [Treponema sp. OMZ 840]|uniref:DNA-methyltransferase n=1 Tax=Treponema sp. OMZ 840 TaxID=244313 RepID=UPI003D8E66C4
MSNSDIKQRSPKNKTLRLSEEERVLYKSKLVYAGSQTLSLETLKNKTLCADLFGVLDALPPFCADLLIIDPPYNLDKNFHGFKFSKSGDEAYSEYVYSWFPRLLRVLKPNGSVYICGDWKSSFCLYEIMKKHTVVRSRITWQREKGRGARANWKNACEDIWFGTIGDDYYFDADAVKQKRRVLAPYRENGAPKDWQETENGNFRLTSAGNFWDDISVPYWSMSENTDHPTQKPEKLIAKLILASCPEDGLVFDPFLGSGTTSVTAKKLGRNFIGIEMNEEYCCWAEKRLKSAETDKTIQGYADGVFWERNTSTFQQKRK